MDTLTQSRNALELRPLRQAAVRGDRRLLRAVLAPPGPDAAHEDWNIQLVGRDGQPPSVPLLMLRYILAWPLVLAARLVWLAARYTGWPSMDMFIVAAPS